MKNIISFLFEKLSEFNVWIMCGLPGSGKSTYIKEELPKNIEIINQDSIRVELGIMDNVEEKKLGNKAAASAAENSNIQRGVVIGGSRMLNNTTRSNAQTVSQPRMVNCTRCNGRGRVQGNDGYVYSCSRCNGTGTIFIK